VGELGLALDARALAWSSSVPEPQRTQELAAVLRVRLAPLLEAETEEEEESPNGTVPSERRNGVPS
jgi:hypothetical protein